MDVLQKKKKITMDKKAVKDGNMLKIAIEDETIFWKEPKARLQAADTCGLVSGVIFCIIFMGFAFVKFTKDPDLRIMVDSYNGLSGKETGGMISPAFNLSFYGDNGFVFCYHGGVIKIWYREFRIARGLISRSCLDSINDQTAALFAQGNLVKLPHHLESRFYSEVDDGTAVLTVEIKLLVRQKSKYIMWWVSCQPVIGNKELSGCKLRYLLPNSVHYG